MRATSPSSAAVAQHIGAPSDLAADQSALAGDGVSAGDCADCHPDVISEIALGWQLVPAGSLPLPMSLSI